MITHGSRSKNKSILTSAILNGIILLAGCSVVFPTEYAPDFSMEDFLAIEPGSDITHVVALLGEPFSHVVHVREYEVFFAEYGLTMQIERGRILGVQGELEGSSVVPEEMSYLEFVQQFGPPTAIENISYRASMLYSRLPGSGSPIKGPYKRAEIFYDPKSGTVLSTRDFWYFD